MKKFLPRITTQPRGFTLVELLIVIAVIAVISTIGFAVYSNLNLQPKARNNVRMADLDAIAKALEVNKASTGYIILADSQFSNGKIPVKDPQGLVYCANTDASTQPADITAVPTASACTPSGATNYSPVSASAPLAGTKWKICTWLEDEDGSGAGVAKAFCKVSSQ